MTSKNLYHVIDGDIDYVSSKEFQHLAIELIQTNLRDRPKGIIFLINSGGGNVASAVAMFGMIQSIHALHIRTVGVVTGCAESSALFLLQTMSVRLSLPARVLTAHAMTSGLTGDCSVERLKADKNDLLSYIDIFAKAIEHRTHLEHFRFILSYKSPAKK